MFQIASFRRKSVLDRVDFILPSLEATGGTFSINHTSCGSAGIGSGGTLTVDADGNMHLSAGVSGDVAISGGIVTAI